MSAIKIEQVKKVDDAGRLARVHHVSRKHAYAGIMPGEVLNHKSFAEREEQWAQNIEKSLAGDGTVWIANDGTFDAGIVACGATRDQDLDKSCVCELYVIYVMPDYLGKGLGKQLFDQAVKQARLEKFKEFVAWVYEPNDRARRFYEKQGMKLTNAKRPAYDKSTISVVRYSMPLA